MDAFEILSAHYTACEEENRLLSRHGNVEFATTAWYIERYLRFGMKILEIGAGPGRYAHYFAREGCEVEAVELVESNIEKFNAATRPDEKIAVRQGNATDLSFYEADSFDVTLLLGPMYHLFTTEDKEKALSEALRVTKSGGVLFAAYCMSDPSILGYGFRKGNIHNLIETGLVNPDTFETTSTPKEVFVLYRREEIDRLVSTLKAERLHFVGTDMYTNYNQELIDSMDDETYALYLKYHFAICERQDMTGMSHHTLDVLRKE